jgi:signal transduction histidine kinase
VPFDDIPEADATFAVIAHALLNSMAVITGTISTLLDNEVPPPRRTDLLGRALNQAEHVTGVLQDLVRGMHPRLVEALDRLDAEEPSR